MIYKAKIDLKRNETNVGYRPHVFVRNEMLGIKFLTEMKKGLNEVVFFEEMYEQYGVDYSELRIGVEFEVREGPNAVGFGRITEVAPILPRSVE